MTKGLIEAQDNFLNRINSFCNKLGLNNVMAQLYTVLYFSNDPLSLDEMAERLKISKASASIYVRSLERYGAVRSVWVKGSRKDYYEAEMDIAKVVMDRIRSMAQGRLSEADNMVKSSRQIIDSIEPADKEDKESIKSYRQKLDRLAKLQGKAEALFNMFNSGLVTSLLTNGSSRKRSPAKVS